jgi:hypothetical protein
MNRMFRQVCASTLMVAGAAQAGGLTVNVQLPQPNVAEYHRPYVAVWIEGPDQMVVANLAVWYQAKKEGGTRWLTDLRQWWRRSGREQRFPIDGVTGATRPAGQHILQFDAGKAPLANMPAGEYQLVVEAVREAGGREALRLPLKWPPVVEQRASAQGNAELRAVNLQATP